MARSLSAEEVRQQKIAAMGEELGTLHYELWNEIAWIHAKWKQYLDLYGGSPERLQLLNRAAPHFFYFLQGILFDDVLLHLCRLTDPPESRGKQNLTIRRLREAIDDEEFRGEVRVLIEEACNKTEFARDRRNRQLAHRDLLTARREHPEPLAPATRERVEDALEGLRNVMNSLESHFLDSEVAYDLYIDPLGAEALLAHLKRAEEAYAAERRGRTRGGDV